MPKKKRKGTNSNLKAPKSTIKIFQEKEYQVFYNNLLRLFLSKEEAKKIVFNCIENNLECDLTQYKDTLEERLTPLKEKDIQLRGKHNIFYKFAVRVGFVSKNTVEEIKFISSKETKFKETGYNVFLEGSHIPVWIEEKYLFNTIEDATEFINKREDFLYNHDWISEIISDCESVNQLLKIEDIFKEIFKRSNGILNEDDDFDEILDIVECNWEGKTVTIKDGSEVYLDRWKSCILHSYDDLYNDFTYKIADDWYICGNCLELLKSDPNNITDNHLFPKNWTDRGIYCWLEKNCWELVHPEEAHRMISYAMREYNDYDYDEDFMDFMDEDDDDYMYGDLDSYWTEEDEAEYETNLMRNKIASNPKCNEMMAILRGLEYTKKEAREKAIDLALEDKFYNKEELINIQQEEVKYYKEFTDKLSKELGKKLNYAVGKKDIIEIDYVMGKERKLIKFKVKNSALKTCIKPSKIFGTLEEAQKYFNTKK